MSYPRTTLFRNDSDVRQRHGRGRTYEIMRQVSIPSSAMSTIIASASLPRRCACVGLCDGLSHGALPVGHRRLEQTVKIVARDLTRAVCE